MKIKITPSITPRESEVLIKYLQEISKYPLLKAKQEVDLAKRIKQGDQDARKELINANLRFVVSVAKKYQNKGLSLEDLINEGNIGLIQAVDTFDETKGFKFTSHAVWKICGSITTALSSKNKMIHTPSNQLRIESMIYATISDLMHILGDDKPSAEEILEKMKEKYGEKIPPKLDAAGVQNIIDATRKHLSLDQPLGDDGEDDGYTILSTVKGGEQTHEDLDNADNEKIVRHLLSKLKQKKKIIIVLHYHLGSKYLSQKEQARLIEQGGIRISDLDDPLVTITKEKICEIFKFRDEEAINIVIREFKNQWRKKEVEGLRDRKTSTIQKIDRRKRKNDNKV